MLRATLAAGPSLILAFAAACSGPPPGGTGEPLPADVLVFDSDRTGKHEIFTMKTDGSDVRQLTQDPASECWWGKISPERLSILFVCAPVGAFEDYAQTSLWTLRAGGIL